MSHTPEELQKQIKDAQERSANPKAVFSAGGKLSTGSGATALRAATDLVAAIAVGGFLGYWVDQWLGTKPWLMIVMIFVGFAAGFMNIYRSQAELAEKGKMVINEETENRK